MGKQATQERIQAGEDTIKVAYGDVVAIFEEHIALASKNMTAEHAAANAHDAVQRYLATKKEAEVGDPMR